MIVTEALVTRIAEAVAQRVQQRRRAPRATYRLQFHQEFTFRDAAGLADYLQRLGISDIYASPYLKARPGSPHGYDVCDHNRLHADLGSEQDFRDYVAALQHHGLSQILDIVPNHMGIAPDHNRWWRDVLENGPSSPYSEYFDINWNPHKEELRNKVLLPVLGAQYGNALDCGDLQLRYHDGAFVLQYFDQSFPIEPCSSTLLLEYRLDELREQFAAREDSRPEDEQEYESIVTALHTLPSYSQVDPESASLRQREKEVIKRRLSRLTEECPLIADFVQANVQAFNVNPEDSASVDRLDDLLAQQPYRLAYWKVAGDEINYRRFFDINELAALCMENDLVFRDTHRMVLELLVRDDILGLRIDHIDGLYDPRQYLENLQRGFLESLARQEFDKEVQPHGNGEHAPPWDEIAGDLAAQLEPLRGSSRRPSLYVVVEKILGVEEPLPEDWPTAGTTGYDFLNSLNGLFVDPDGLREVIRSYERFINRREAFDDIAYRSKHLILDVAMSSELQMLARRLNVISERNRSFRDFTLNRLRHALREILASFPVYRTYIRTGEISDRDRHFIQLAVALAKQRNPAVDFSVFDFIRDVLLMEQGGEVEPDRDVFIGRFQQVTSPVMAKGVEDTTFYLYCPLVSLNEVGAEPEHAPTSVDKFHGDNLERLACRPDSLICTSTHDTKRSEDTRARIDVISEIPHLWRKAVNNWSRLNRRFRREVDGMPAPTRRDEYLFYQTLVGIWPMQPLDDEAHQNFIARAEQYMAKATHEAKEMTSWINPNPAYDDSVRDFVRSVLERRKNNRFLERFQQFHDRIYRWGLYTALSQALLKLASPGVPDIYQGQELWDFSLVDPDNRRPVDFQQRAWLLGELENVVQDPQQLREGAHALADDPSDNRSKLLVTWRTLNLRRQYAEVMGDGHYIPVQADGDLQQHVCAFIRQSSRAGRQLPATLTVVPRLLAQLTPAESEEALTPPPLGKTIWKDTTLHVPELDGLQLSNQFTGETLEVRKGKLPMSDVLAHFPVALLLADEAS